MSAPSLPGSPSTRRLVLINFKFVPNRRRHDTVEKNFWLDIKATNADLFLMFSSFFSICLRKVRLKEQEYKLWNIKYVDSCS